MWAGQFYSRGAWSEDATFAPGSKLRMRYLRPRYGEIIYYAPREEKTWSVHSSCELTNTSCGLANFTPAERILFFRHTLAESTTFAPSSKTRMWYFRPGYDEK